MISSVAVQAMGSHGGPYNMAKAALEALALTLAKEEERHGIRVNVIRPGFVDTRLAHLVGERMASPSGLPPMLSPDAIAAAVRFYASSDADHVNGQTLAVS